MAKLSFSPSHKPFANVKRGFTLIELLAVIGIISVVGAVAADIFLNVTRSYSKANAMVEVERSGNTALSQMVGEIRNSRSLSPTSGTTDTLAISAVGGDTVTFSFVPPGGSSNGYVARNGIPLTDAAYSSGVNVTSFSFTVTDADPPIVSITLTLEQPLGATKRIYFQAGTTLQTTVSLRTYE